MQAIQQALQQAQLGRLRPAIAALERLTQKKGAPPEAYHFLGMLLAQDGRLDHALFNLERACRMSPGRAQFESNLAGVLASAGRTGEALARFESAARIDRSYAPARIGLAGALLTLGRLADAEREAREGWRLDPANPQGAANLASALIIPGRAHEAVDHLRGAIDRLGPGITLNTLLTAAMNYDARSTPEQLLDAHRTLGRLHAGAARAFADGLPPLKTPDPDARPVRLGFLSAAFRDHPVGMFIEPALEPGLEAGGGVEVFCYDCTGRRDAFGDRLRRRGATWRDGAGLTDAALASLVRTDGIDVLVELSGHSLGNRQTALAARMAPVQVSYLGYPATTGNPAIDARLVDGLSDPDGAGAWCTERLVRLDPCAWCFTAPADGPRVSASPAGERGPVSFGSFNNLSKTTPGVLDQWAGLLARVPGSRLVLKNGAFADEPTRARIIAELGSRAVAPGRVDARPPTGDGAAHLRAYADVDIALDTFPYAGTTTTCEALWMGVPVVTLAGRLHAGRVGVSLLGAVGLGDLVAPDGASFIEIAASLAADRARLAGLRRTLRARMEASALMDGGAFRERLHGACVALVREKGGAR